jgi:biopolymer transport protein ExbB
MTRFIDTWMPWLGDLLELGGPLVGMILVIAFFMWVLLFERLYYLFAVFPGDQRAALREWYGRRERTSWYAEQSREALTGRLGSMLMRNFSLIGTMIKVCPLLGLLGTVLGMLEVFDALAATGSNNPRSMAAGVSKATVSTLAGMVVAIVGLLANTIFERRAAAARDGMLVKFTRLDTMIAQFGRIEDQLEQPEDQPRA